MYKFLDSVSYNTKWYEFSSIEDAVAFITKYFWREENPYCLWENEKDNIPNAIIYNDTIFVPQL